MSATKKERGFAPPNYTQVPNLIFDELLPVMSNAELRVTLVVTRLTKGWHQERSNVISVEEIASLGGLSPNSAKTGIAEAVKRGSIRRIKCRDERNRVTYKYALNINGKLSVDEIDRPRKTREEQAQGEGKSVLSSQNLAGSISGCFKVSTSQNLAGLNGPIPVVLSSQNLAGSYKEERNSIESIKEKRGQTTPLAQKNASENFAENDTKSQCEPEGKQVSDQGEKHQSPDGETASAVDTGKTFPSQEKNVSSNAGNVNVTNSENVPGGAAAGGARADGEPDPAVEKYIRTKLSAKFVDALLEEVQPLGVDRRKDWFGLSLERVQELFAEAVRTHQQHKVKVPTRVRDLLDQECQNAGLLPPAPLDDDGEIDMDALMRGAPLSGSARRIR